jgi:hypothetical protein
LTTRPERKLREAGFFLARLQEEAGKHSEAFCYYLSAFLAAADSVIHIARKEVGIKTVDFNSWKTVLDPRERELLCFMTKQRNAEVHQDGADIAVEPRASPVTFYPHVELLPIQVLFSDAIEEGPTGPHGLAQWVRVWVPSPEHVFRRAADTAPALKECERYYRVVSKFLKWAEGSR